MTDAQRVMKSRYFTRKYRSGKYYVITLTNQSDWSDDWVANRFTVTSIRGHTWAEAFRKAALHLVTQRVTQ